MIFSNDGPLASEMIYITFHKSFLSGWYFQLLSKNQSCDSRSSMAAGRRHFPAQWHITLRQHEVAERKRRYLPKRGENFIPKTTARGRAPDWAPREGGAQRVAAVIGCRAPLPCRNTTLRHALFLFWTFLIPVHQINEWILNSPIWIYQHFLN